MTAPQRIRLAARSLFRWISVPPTSWCTIRFLRSPGAEEERYVIRTLSERAAVELGDAVARGLQPGGVCAVYDGRTTDPREWTWFVLAAWKREAGARGAERIEQDPFA